MAKISNSVEYRQIHPEQTLHGSITQAFVWAHFASYWRQKITRDESVLKILSNPVVTKYKSFLRNLLILAYNCAS